MSRLRRLFSSESGFTMISVVTGMMVISMFALGAYTAALGDIPVGRKDQDRKRALEAAKAGVEWYTYQLLRDTNYWTYCSYQAAATPSPLPGVNIQGVKTSTRTLPNSQAKFAVELMSGNGSAYTRSACIANPGLTLLNNGVLRIRVTGTAGGKSRQLVATFRRNSFLDYLYYTKWETLPPATYADPNQALIDCDKPRTDRASSCSKITFASDDTILGPMHTEDSSFMVCDTPTFGRTPSDNIEVALATSRSNAYVASSGCSKNPDVDTSTTGTTIFGAKSLDLPPSNAGLEQVANYVTTGQTCLQFNSGGTVTVWSNQTWSETITCTGATQTYTLGANTVFYTKNGAGCTGGYVVKQRYNDSPSCGNVAVKGTYTGNVTIGAANDIIVTGDLEKPSGGDQMMGLIGQNFVRVYHTAIDTNDDCSASAGSGTSRVNNIEAAILSLTSSFIVDSWDCGAHLGDLTIKGNIAQKWRGTVGRGDAGYTKDYQYDDRLKYRQPPQFLDPLKASWHVLRQSEQSPVQ